MPYAGKSSLSKKQVLAVILTVAAAAVVLLLSTQGSSARAESCVGGAFCAWTGTNYSGTEQNEPCNLSTGTSFELKSAQNHCAVNVRIGWIEGGTVNWKACMTPGGLRPEPGRFNTISPGGC